MVKNKKGNAFLALLSPLWGALKAVVFLLLLAFGLLEVFTPSLNYTSYPPKPFRSASPPGWVEPNETQPLRSYHTNILTNDYRNLQVDYFTPDNLSASPIPLTVIVTGFMMPEWLLPRVNPRGFNAVVIYRSPRIARVARGAFPTLLQARNARTFTDYWNLMGTNPLNYMYNIHAGLHEAPGDIADIVRWAVGNINADPGRINIVGLGTGALVAAAAVDGLQTSGIPPRTLTLVNPPADISSAVADNLLNWPRWMRQPLAKIMELVYFRLDLSRHVPHLTSTKTLMVIPHNSFELATYAAEPVTYLTTGTLGTTQYIDMHYKGFYDDRNVSALHDMVGRWLIDKGGIQSY